MSTPKIVAVTAAGLLLLCGVVLAASEGLRSADTARSVVNEPVERIVVKTDTGDVDIRAGLTGNVVIEREDAWLLDRPEITQSVNDGTLYIESSCDGIGFFFRCESDFTIAAPPGVDVDVAGDSSEVFLKGLRGRVAVNTDAGDIHAERLEPVTLQARTDAGDVRLDLFGAPARTVATSDAGDVEMIVPFGAYRVDVTADAGEVEVAGLLRDDLAPQRISAAADAGDVSIRAR
jgi:hypothetical protein